MDCYTGLRVQKKIGMHWKANLCPTCFLDSKLPIHECHSSYTYIAENPNTSNSDVSNREYSVGKDHTGSSVSLHYNVCHLDISGQLSALHKLSCEVNSTRLMSKLDFTPKTNLRGQKANIHHWLFKHHSIENSGKHSDVASKVCTAPLEMPHTYNFWDIVITSLAPQRNNVSLTGCGSIYQLQLITIAYL